ncbi:hypothetical protein COCON_G00205240 [Conger conger]|uniref:non-specific serine/threonine protein kinase n=1 Tax=Conger conger TaxID=82655 RepID=A0A9Q1HPF4_CONCO|nr:hypothetical protein COCON_G00205240 [Conger conger]
MMENCHGLYLLLATGILQLALVVEGAPLPSDTGFAAEGLPVLGLSLAVSVATLVALLVLLLNCTSCCKERDINFEEFDDNFPDEVDFTPPAEDTPSLQPNTEVYTLAVPPLALPGPPRLEPPPNTGVREESTAPQVTRQSLSYIQEIGNGWFGKVLLSEIFSEQELGASRVLVQELAASADSPEQKRFLLQAEPYRVLQHPNIVHCLGQCVDSVPFLLVFEHCELGDLKGCLRQQDWMLHNIELLQLQKMACEIAAGVTHLHKHNFLHSDLALRNCFLTSDLTVKVGDYGTGPSRYKDDYLTVAAEQMVPLRWVAPELVSGPHTSLGGLVTKPGNVWALGVTLWELLESAAQPYSQLSDQEVLIHVIKDQNVRLSKPQLDLPYSDRWYEALQFCWLPQDKRATAEEVHRLLTYLRMQGQRQAEEDFQQRWDALRPRPAQGHTSFPILDRFSEPDELLTVTETSHGLSFEYVWEAARHDPSALSHQSVFFPTPHYEAPEPAEAAHGLLSVFDKSGSGNEYYIQLEDQELGAGERNSQCSQPGAGPQPNVLLQDTGLDESGTEPDFFHQSLDSRDSNPASQPESPYRAHIFSESTSSAPDHPWASSLLDLPEFSTGSLQRGVPSVEAGMGNSSAFGGFMDLSHLGEAEGQDVVGGHLLDLPNLSDDFLFPRAGNLAREGGNWGQRKDALVTDSDSVPDPDLRVISMEYSEVATSDEVESASDPALSRDNTPQALIPDPPLDQTSQESLLDDSGLASVTTVEGLAETPDSTESLNVHQLQPPCRTTDSGYDTENMESPECSSKGEVSPEGEDSAEPSPIAPEVIVLEAESTLDAVEIIFPSSPAPMESPLAIGHQNYRDSAYFSDNESEPEKRLEESGTGDPTGSTLWQTESLRASGVTCNILAPNKEEEGNTGLPESQCKVPQEPENLCNWKSVPELVLTPAETWAQGEAGSINGCEETGEQSTLGSREDPAGHARPSSPPAPEVHDGTFHAKLVRTHAGMGPGPKFRERDAEGRYLVAGGDGAEDGSEADEEDENSEDSDDEDMQAYRLHSSASDSDDEPPPPAPIIIMDTSHARSLRSLLKAAAPSSAVSNAHSLPGKKAVSFFNDVTLYLFDQETPTKDLGDQLSGSCSQASECCSPAPSSSLLNRVTNSESSTDEEGGTFEWDDDFSSSDSFVSKATGDLDKPKASPAVASHYFSPPPPGHAPEQSWSRPSSFSRFSISPASISNFSLTHLTDSDMEQGSSEDGEKE